MRTIYQNIPEVITFFNKAQNKIAELAILVASEREEDEKKRLLLDLSDFLESLDSPYCNFSTVDTLRYIQFWNKRANLTSTPFIQITDYIVNITGCTPDISSIEDTIKQLLATYPHNNLAGIQGGTLLERYHLTKAEKDWLACQMAKTPCPDRVDPTVSLTLTPNRQPSSFGFYELGTSISLLTLGGAITYGSEKKASYFEYQKNSVTLGVRNSNPGINDQPNTITDTNLNQTATYSFVANFSLAGLKTASQTVSFVQPMYYGLIRKDHYNDIATMQSTGTKLVRDKGDMSLTFSIPTGNTLLPGETYLVPFIFIPESWGMFAHANVLAFDYISDWPYFGGQMTLADGTKMNGIYAFYNNQSEGDVTFNFSY